MERIVQLCLLALALIVGQCPSRVESIIFFQGRTSACNVCDRISTNSLRNIGCCLKFSKCCIPDNLDTLNRRVAAEEAEKRPIRWPDEDTLNGDEDRAVQARRTSRAKKSKKRRSKKARRSGGQLARRDRPSLPRTIEIDDWLKIDVRNGLATYGTL